MSVRKHLFCWGASWTGQLGLGSSITSQYTPKKLLTIDNNQNNNNNKNNTLNNNTNKIVTGSYHTLFKNNDKLYVWGDYKQGQLGLINNNNNNDNTQTKPILHPFFNSEHITIISIGCGGYHSIVCVYDCKLSTYNTYAFGRNNEGQLGIDSNYNSVFTPTLIESLIGRRLEHISCGPNYTVLITEDNVVYTFGMNDFGQCAHKSNDHIISKPKIIEELKGISKVKKISSGWGHTLLAIDNGEKLITWGSNFHGQCGIGSKGKQPISIQEVKVASKIIDLSCGSAASIAVLSNNNNNNNTAFVWGSCGDGKLGGNQTEDIVLPTEMDNLPNNINRVSFGTDHCIVSTTDNRLFGWGFGQHGALGVGSTRNELKVYKTPVEIKSEINQFEILDLECSIDTSFSIVSDK